MRSGLDVWEILELLRSYEGKTEKVLESHPLVSERHLRLARAYAERFPEEIQEFLEANRRPLEELPFYPFPEVPE